MENNLKDYKFLSRQQNFGSNDILAYIILSENTQIFNKFKNIQQWFKIIDAELLKIKSEQIQYLGGQTQVKEQQNNSQTKIQDITNQQNTNSQQQKVWKVKYDKIIPNEKEQILFDYLKSYIKDKNIKVVMRAAGGWVRDKLLGRESDDIDIALDTMMGEQFIRGLQQYAKENGEEIRQVGVIKANPDQSKHLETATCTVKGFSIDFVNLRGEEYAANSRIPTITFGTPVQDAERRDLTMNSMFYNINEDKIEDYCKTGLQDLKNGICRTPLDPYKTFNDDPLRILRTFRFASRYNFEIQNDLLLAIQKPEIQKALDEKISRERIRTEYEKMLKCQHPFRAIELIYRNNLWKIVYQIQKQQLDAKLVEQLSHQSFEFVKLGHSQFYNFQKFLKYQILSQQDIQFYYYMSLSLLNYTPFKLLDKKKKEFPLIFFILETSLKMSKNECDNIVKICEQALEFENIINNKPENIFSSIVKIIIKNKNLWEISFFLAKIHSSQDNHQKFDELYKYILEKHLENIYEVKPLINGNDVQQLYGKGKVIGTVGKNILYWQYENYGKTQNDLQQFMEQDRKKDPKDQYFLVENR